MSNPIHFVFAPFECMRPRVMWERGSSLCARINELKKNRAGPAKRTERDQMRSTKFFESAMNTIS